MTETRARLIRCIQAVFPGVSERDAVNADGSWDSVAMVTLAAVIEEEFGIQFEPEEIEKLKSFDNCLSLLTCK
jgi:acyl carrier protein